jgi:hypothetical protein
MTGMGILLKHTRQPNGQILRGQLTAQQVQCCCEDDRTLLKLKATSNHLLHGGQEGVLPDGMQ